MSAIADKLANSYLAWIKSNLTAETLADGVTELTTPFLDRHHDNLQIYAERREGDAFLLTDDGYIIAELKASGVEPRGVRRETIFHELLSGHGVTLDDDELHIEADSSNLGQRAHSLVQAMLSLDDMFVLAQPRVESVFIEDVTNFLDVHDIRYSPRVKFAGRSGLDHLVDFVIPKSKCAPERILQVVNTPRRDRIESFLFAVNDTRAARGLDLSYFAIINDSRIKVPRDVMEALSAYEIESRLWSRREELVESLAA